MAKLITEDGYRARWVGAADDSTQVTFCRIGAPLGTPTDTLSGGMGFCTVKPPPSYSGGSLQSESRAMHRCIDQYRSRDLCTNGPMCGGACLVNGRPRVSIPGCVLSRRTASQYAIGHHALEHSGAAYAAEHGLAIRRESGESSLQA